MTKTTKTTKTKKTKKPAETLQEQVNAVIENDPLDAPTEISLAKFKKLFKEEIAEAADYLEREDKEGDFEDSKTIKAAALSFVRDQHPEYIVVD
jgi:hypothetical protein